MWLERTHLRLRHVPHPFGPPSRVPVLPPRGRSIASGRRGNQALARSSVMAHPSRARPLPAVHRLHVPASEAILSPASVVDHLANRRFAAGGLWECVQTPPAGNANTPSLCNGVGPSANTYLELASRRRPPLWDHPLTKGSNQPEGRSGKSLLTMRVQNPTLEHELRQLFLTMLTTAIGTGILRPCGSSETISQMIFRACAALKLSR